MKITVLFSSSLNTINISNALSVPTQSVNSVELSNAIQSIDTNLTNLSSKNRIQFEFKDICLPNLTGRALPTYKLADRQLRHSVQSPGSFKNIPRSYSELIELAIQSAPTKKMLLASIYDWMYQNVPEFSDDRIAPNEASWKNSIRHNLRKWSKYYFLTFAD